MAPLQWSVKQKGSKVYKSVQKILICSFYDNNLMHAFLK